MQARPFTLAALVFGFVCLAGCDKTPPETASTSSAPPASAAPTLAASTVPAATPAAVPPEPVKPAGLPAPDDVAAPPADAKKTASGLALKVLTPGKGKDHPGSDDTVKV